MQRKGDMEGNGEFPACVAPSDIEKKIEAVVVAYPRY
jgi:hypothetical protein